MGEEGSQEAAPLGTTAINFLHLKFKFMGFSLIPAVFFVVELLFLFAGIKVSGS